MRDDTDEKRVRSALARFAEYFSEDVIFENDRTLSLELEREARPAIESLVMALSFGSADDERSLSHHEGLAMVTLLGRRAAVLGVTLSGAERLLRSICLAMQDMELPIPAGAMDALRLAGLEGYVRGRDESIRRSLVEDAETSISAQPIVEGVWCLALHGPLDAEAIERLVNRFSRTLHRRGATAAILDLTSFRLADGRRASAILSVDESAKMLGVPLHFAGVDQAWGAAFDYVAHKKALRCHSDLQGALTAAMKDIGWTFRRRFRLRSRRTR